MRRGLKALAVRHATPALLSLVDQGLVSGFGFLTGIATARLVGIAPFGRFVIVMIFVGLAQNVHNALATAPMMTLMGGRLRASKAYDLSFMAAATLLSIGAGIAVAMLLDGFFALRGEILSIGFLLAAALVAAAQNFQFTLRRFLFAQGRGPQAIVMDAARALMFPFALVALHVLTGPLTVVRLMWVLGATALVTSLPFVLPFLRHGGQNLRLRAVVRRHVPLARWLLPVVVVTFGQEQLVWILAGSVLGDAAMGGLRSAQYVVGLVLLMLTATENVIPVGAARTFAQAGRSGLNRYLVATGAKLGALVVVGLLVIGIPAEFWLKLVFGAPFVPFANCLRVLAVAALFIHVRDMATHMFRATKNTGVIFRAFVVSGLVSLLCLYPLLHEAGLLGAALVVLIGHATSMIYLLTAALWPGGGAQDGLHDLVGRLFSVKANTFKARSRNGPA